MYLDELRRAIAQPAAKNGVVFEEGLIRHLQKRFSNPYPAVSRLAFLERSIEQIIEEVERQKGYLPLLQYTLDLLWEKESGLTQRNPVKTVNHYF